MTRPGRAFLLAACLAVACAADIFSISSAQVEQSAQVVGQYEKLELTIGHLRFHDVGWDNWALGEIEACVEAGIVQGYPDGAYRPGATVDRAQMAVYIARALAGGDDMVPEGSETATFSDVSTDHWAFAHIEYAVSEGVVQGFADSMYRPGREVDRAQMAAFVARAMAGGEPAVPDPECTTPPFADVPCDFWARKHIQYLVAAGVVGVYGDGSYRPHKDCNRNQMAAYMARAFGKGGADMNFFDPEQIAVDAIFTTPSGARIEVPGFYYRPYRRVRYTLGEREWEEVQATGSGVFKVRFAWAEVGDYSYEVVATSQHGSDTLGVGAFAVAASDALGYVRISQATPGYFQHETGEPYFAIGENMCVMYGLGTYNYEVWMTKLAEHGGNHVRVWLCHHMNLLDLEHLPRHQGDGNGLGRYDQGAAWRADYVLELAEQLGIRVMLTTEDWHSVNTDRADAAWHRSPYNQANGGPCHEPMDFFTNEEAKRLYRQRLRYLAGRWGYSTSVLAWELWNEVDGTAGYLRNVASVAAWHEEMGAHLRSIDPWAHLRTTSCGWDRGGWEMNDVGEIDYVQSHLYCAHDMASAIHEACEDDAQYGKPFYPGEFGVGEEEKWSDPEGIALHNGLWAAVLSGAAGTAMNWSWDVVDEYDLYRHFAAVAAFGSDVDWVGEDYVHELMGVLPLRVLMLKNETSALLWVQNRGHTWWAWLQGWDPAPVDQCEVALTGLMPGTYRVERWDTYAGQIADEWLQECPADTVNLTTPDRLLSDVAYKVRRVEGGGGH